MAGPLRPPHRCCAAVAFLHLLCALLLPWAAVAKVDLDPSFGADGTVVMPLPMGLDGGAYLVGVRELSGGQLLILAGFEPTDPGDARGAILYRLLPTGAPDPDFGVGADGIVFLAPTFLGANAAFSDLEVLADGRIVLAGFQSSSPAQGEWFVTRLLPDGFADPSFRNGEWLRIQLGTDARLHAMALVPGTSKVVLAGSTPELGGVLRRVVVARVTSHGLPDLTLGTSGIVLRDFGSSPISLSQAYDVTVQADGKIVVVGDWNADDGSGGLQSHWAIARLTVAGDFDGTFGTSAQPGVSIGDFSPLGATTNFAQFLEMAQFPDGSLAAAGHFVGPSDFEVGIVRFGSSGAPVAGWAAAGYRKIRFTPSLASYIGHLATDDAGRLLVAGVAFYSFDRIEAGAARLLAGGSLDPHFCGDGTCTFPFDTGGESHGIEALIDSRGRPVIAGQMLYFAGPPLSGLYEARPGLARMDSLFCDGFESGNLTAWTSSEP